MVLNKEVPQWILDIFNKINFNSIPVFIKNISLTGLEKWADSNLPKYDEKKNYKPAPKRTIKKNFDEKLLNILNKYEYSHLSKDDIKQITNYLNNMIAKMPK